MESNIIPFDCSSASNAQSSFEPNDLKSRAAEENENHLSTYLIEGILESFSLHDNDYDKISEKKASCSCDDGSVASSYCLDCKDYLCSKCVSAHYRVKLTKDHNMTPVSSYQMFGQANMKVKDLMSNSLSDSKSLTDHDLSCCELHPNEVLRLYCDLCSVAICSPCAVLNHSGHNIRYLKQAIDASKMELLSLLSEAKAQMNALEKISQNVETTIENLDTQANTVCTDIQATIRKITTVLENRQHNLVYNVQQIRQEKFKVLCSQIKTIHQGNNDLKLLVDQVKQTFDTGSNMEILKAKESLSAALVSANRLLTRNRVPHEDSNIIFSVCDPGVQEIIGGIGKVSGGASATFSMVSGMGVSKAKCNKFSHFEVITFNPLGEPCSTGGDPVHVVITAPDGTALPFEFMDRQDGTYTVRYQPVVEGEHIIMVTIRGLPVVDSPFRVCVKRSQQYFEGSGIPRLMFGSEGEKDGQLCRPWGIACDSRGYFVVADRSNNRIQIFTPDGSFLRKFGIPGKRPGQLDRPAGVVVDRDHRIVLADKDNHRIQIFTFNGNFLLMFGERGSKNGQFNYPWDVASDSRGMIAVTDTRNHRVQLFNNEGMFISKYGFEGMMWKHFDSPRGIDFISNTSALVVSDFNNHRLVIIQPDLRSARFLGSEGSQPSQFLRPQGVAVDEDGNFVIADSRNHRLQVFSPSGTFIAMLGGTQGNGPNQMDRPSGIAIMPNAGIAVVDFGNNRILVY